MVKKKLRDLAYTILTRAARPFYGGLGCIVCLHRVLPESERSQLPGNRALEITPADLQALIDWALGRGLEPVGMDDVPARLRQPRGGKFIAFTFDDGYRDNFTHALPIFRTAGVPFTVNATTGFISATEPVWWYAIEQIFAARETLTLPWGETDRLFPLRTLTERESALQAISGRIRAMGVPERNAWLRDAYAAADAALAAHTRSLILDWQELRVLAAEPLVTIGAHSIGHYDFSQLEDDEVRREMTGSKRELEERLERPVRHFAFPFGGRTAVGEREIQFARECGFETAVTTRSANLFPAHVEHLTALPRLGVSGNYDALSRFIRLESGFLTAVERRGRRVICQ